MGDATFLEVDDSIKAKNLLLFVSIGTVNIHIFDICTYVCEL